MAVRTWIQLQLHCTAPHTGGQNPTPGTSKRLSTNSAMETYSGVEVQLHTFLASAVDECDWSEPHPGERPHGTHWT